jgi:hypothetical protein
MKENENKVEIRIIPRKFKPMVKMGGIICNVCRVLLKTNLDKKDIKGKTSLVLCDDCLEYIVRNTSTEYPEGFTLLEEHKLIKRFPQRYFSYEKYYDALQGTCCKIIDNEILINPGDLILAIKCGMQNKNVNELNEY